ncbi:MAG: hypothetical protein K5917_01815 [Clostridiales bacterium]|nr:hypothetical protein [Clostridiales bacterium]
MNFFDNLIDEIKSGVSALNQKNYPFNNCVEWKDLGRNEVIMLRDSAFELDGVGFNLVTSSEIGEDSVTVIGKDMKELKEDTAFARISFIQIDDVDDEQKAYDLIRKIEYAKYHFFPEGYMMRTTSRSNKENVRVSKDALKSGLDFETIGSMMIKKYKENPCVKSVKVFFVTDEKADFKFFDEIAKKNYEITQTLNHIMNNVKFDCDSCNLKPICDEVEGMKELHFKNAGKM